MLNFKLDKIAANGCTYVVVSWKPGNTKRRLVSCHKQLKIARDVLTAAVEGERRNMLRKLPKMLTGGARKFAIYNTKTGKKVKP